MSQAWMTAGEEPAWEEILGDPIVHLVLRRDGLTVEAVRAAWHRGRAALAAADRPQSVPVPEPA